MPRTVDAYNDACKSLDFQTQIAEYVGSSVNASYPITDDRCPRCGREQLLPTAVKVEAFRKPKNGALRSSTSECAGCRTSFSANEVVEGQMNRLSSEFSVDPILWSSEYVHYKVAMPDPLPMFAPIGKDV